MVYEDVKEPIEMISVFRQGRMRPLKFRWRDRVYRITRIHGGWISDEGYSKRYHYSVSSDGPDCFEIFFDTGNMSWELTRVFLEG